ncbi:hypothetical protein Dvina_34715 [Dactylosporangium vinaceum]|uniref:Tetratricopeptide repeat protein n=1 Tax=Dactylosporangium vinaceum TaxID=53362 RepID=A0ABV5M4E1_9ACTN|nr:hypothetical protein [Dactylosporangium vinaceum]UAB93387.1 hypothetical protein Dvina_34715 [Dactylosporangium vinaceum]
MRRSELGRVRVWQGAVGERARAYGPDDPRTLAARLELAWACRSVCDAEDAHWADWDRLASDELAAVTAGRVRTLGAEHPDTLAARYLLARWRRPLDRSGDAEYAEAVEHLAAASQRVHGPAHEETLELLWQLAGQVGEPRRSQLLGQVRDGWLEVAARDPDHAEARRLLGRLYEEAGQGDEARAQRDLAVAACERIARERSVRLGEVHPDTVAARIEHAEHVGWFVDRGSPRS